MQNSFSFQEKVLNLFLRLQNLRGKKLRLLSWENRLEPAKNRLEPVKNRQEQF